MRRARRTRQCCSRRCASRWAGRIGGHGYRVGIAWQGSPGRGIDIGRSFPLASFAPLAGLAELRLISLQKGHGAEQLDTPPEGLSVESLGADFDAGPDAFADCAAVMQSLDLVITSDTAIAHLAGALGRPVWVALQHVPDWRWLQDRPDSPWYPTMRLFRQDTPGDWPGVFAAIRAALAQRIDERTAEASPRPGAAPAPAHEPTPRVPVSWGELLDKISILEIKSERITAATPLANVRRELAALREIAAPAMARAEVAAACADLRRVNESLWDIEDRIRAHEGAEDFGPAFITLARAVYRTNDERGRLKRRINDLLGSELVEEKHYTHYEP